MVGFVVRLVVGWSSTSIWDTLTGDVRKRLKGNNPVSDNPLFDFSSNYKKSAEVVLSDGGTVKFLGVWMEWLEGSKAKFHFDKAVPEEMQ